MDDPTPNSDDFWTSAPAASVHVEVEVPELADGGEPPALRTLTRPPSWRAASSPASALTAQYESAQRRATEVLRIATEDSAESPDDDDSHGAGA